MWTTRHLLEICEALRHEQLDREFDIGHKTIRATFEHIISNMEIWSCLMTGEAISRGRGSSLSVMIERLDQAAHRFSRIAREVSERNGWDELWIDHLDNPPTVRSFGSSIAHVITHSMHHRAQIIHMLRKSGVKKLPEGDVFSWESQMHENRKEAL